MKNIPVRKIGARTPRDYSDLPFSIRKVETILKDGNLLHVLHRHDFFFMLALQKGAGKHAIDFTDYKIENNTLFFLRPGQVHQLELKKGSTGYLLEFSAAFYNPSNTAAAERWRTCASINYQKLPASVNHSLQSILASVFREYTHRETGFREAIIAYLDICWIQLARHRSIIDPPVSTAKAYAQERLDEFLSLLENKVTTQKKTVYYAGAMNLTVYQLNQLTRKLLGKPAANLIIDQLILEAKRQLRATSKQVKDIANDLGYEDVSYFIRYFKKHTGFTPDYYRHVADSSY